MKTYSKKDIENIYSQLVNEAKRSFSSRNNKRSLRYIGASALWAYNFNNIYADGDVEKLLKSISENTISPITIENPLENRCVLIDSFLLDNRGLSQQYLRAMKANGMELLVVYTNRGGRVGKDTLEEIRKYEKASILTFPKQIDVFEQTNEIVNTIADFSPGHIFLHLTPWDVVALMACHAIKGSHIYNINLTDHAYWMGASFIDYNLEFRPYGYTESLEMRGLRDEQLLVLPYYPITPLTTKFDGFPSLPTGAIKVFTGGALYKMLGKNDVFFKLMDAILEISPNVVILIAGFQKDARFDRGCSRMKHGDRIVQIGVRKDIDAVFKNVDIYLNTYPMSGALMSQYAARHSLPIIAYHDKGDVMNYVEEFVNHYQNDYKSFDSIENMKNYATKLINDIEFRINEGKYLQAGLMTPERFSAEFMRVISSHRSAWKFEKDKINYDSFFERYLDLENTNGFSASKQLAGALKFEVLKIKGYKLLFAKLLMSLALKRAF